MSKFFYRPPILVLLQRCTSMNELKQIHAHTITNGLSRFAFMSSKILAFCAVSPRGDCGHAETIFNQISTHSILQYHDNGFLQNSKPETGILVYAKMRSLVLEPDTRTLTVFVKTCVSFAFAGSSLWSDKFGHVCDVYFTSSVINMYSYGLMDNANQVFDASLNRNVACWTNLIRGYCCNGLVVEARELFDSMPEKNDVSCSSMVSGYVKNHCFNKAIELFHELKSLSSVKFNGSLLVSVLNACAAIGSFEEGKWVDDYVDENGFEYELELGTALIDFYAKCGYIENACETFNKMPHRDVTTWSALILGLAMNGKNEMGLELFVTMEKKGPKPNAVTFVGDLNACNHKTLVNEAWRLFGRMSQVYGIHPLIEHCGCMVDLLVHGHIELGKKVGKLVIDLDPQRCGRYVLLAYFYATMGCWEDMMRLRKLMKESEEVTISAWSFIEIDGVVHKFLVDDKSHSHWRGIYKVLNLLK